MKLEPSIRKGGYTSITEMNSHILIEFAVRNFLWLLLSVSLLNRENMPVFRVELI